jgi:hypothetical protein
LLPAYTSQDSITNSFRNQNEPNHVNSVAYLQNAHAIVVLTDFSDSSFTGIEEDRNNQVHPCLNDQFRRNVISLLPTLNSLEKRVTSRRKVCEDYRLLVPLPGEEYEVGVHHQQDIRENQQVVGVPEGIETGKVVQG